LKPIAKVLRYDRGGSPLWATKNGKMGVSNVPNCETCNSKRTFEFQIMPQLLSHLKLNEEINVETTLDWASLYIYTCEKNCASQAYTSEFIYKQDFI
jgi:pre-rRNA-processing protein TSR4